VLGDGADLGLAEAARELDPDLWVHSDHDVFTSSPAERL
jgi:hypothetical protein